VSILPLGHRTVLTAHCGYLHVIIVNCVGKIVQSNGFTYALSICGVTATEEVHEQYRSLVRGVGAGWFAACRGGADHKVTLWSPSTGECLNTLEGQRYLFCVCCLRLLPAQWGGAGRRRRPPRETCYK
jgi:hypothetical protein